MEAGEGVIVSGLLFDAGKREVETLVQIGLPGRSVGNAEHPICLHDIFCRVGGYGEGKAQCMVTIYNDHVIGDHLWLWRPTTVATWDGMKILVKLACWSKEIM